MTDGPAGQSVVLACPIATNQRTRCLRQTTDIFTIHDRILTDLHKVLDERIIANEEFTENELKAIIKGTPLPTQHAPRASSASSSRSIAG